MSEHRETLKALLAESVDDSESSFGYTLSSVSFQDEIEIKLRKNGSTFVVWLQAVRGPGDPAPCYRETKRFKIGHRADPPDQLGYALIDALSARIATWEGSLTDEGQAELFISRPAAVEEPDRDPFPAMEWLAVRSGLKPTSRTVAGAELTQRMIDEARASDLHAVVIEAAAFLASFCERVDGTNIVYVGRTEQTAHAAAEAERSMIDTCSRAARVTDAQIQALGEALGYPPCCIEAFIPVRDLSNPEIRFRALRETSGAASHLLNDTGERCVISHAVCRYDCAASIRYAQSLLHELAKNDRRGAEKLESKLYGLVVVFDKGAALRLVPAGPLTSEPYQYATVEGSGEEDVFERWQTALRRGDSVEVQGSDVRIFRGGQEVDRLTVEPDTIQIRLFV